MKLYLPHLHQENEKDTWKVTARAIIGITGTISSGVHTAERWNPPTWVLSKTLKCPGKQINSLPCRYPYQDMTGSDIQEATKWRFCKIPQTDLNHWNWCITLIEFSLWSIQISNHQPEPSVALEAVLCVFIVNKDVHWWVMYTMITDTPEEDFSKMPKTPYYKELYCKYSLHLRLYVCADIQ